MSIDVYGKAPISEAGKHFHRSVWIHFPLVAICKQLSPKVTKPVSAAGLRLEDHAGGDRRLAVGELQTVPGQGDHGGL